MTRTRQMFGLWLVGLHAATLRIVSGLTTCGAWTAAAVQALRVHRPPAGAGPDGTTALLVRLRALHPSAPRSQSMAGTSRIAVGRGAAGGVGRAPAVHSGELGDPVDRPPVLRKPRDSRRGRLHGPAGPHGPHPAGVRDPQGRSGSDAARATSSPRGSAAGTGRSAAGASGSTVRPSR